jgi:hypothetical protein
MALGRARFAGDSIRGQRDRLASVVAMIETCFRAERVRGGRHPQRPERIIVRDTHDEDLYLLRPWLARLLERGFAASRKPPTSSSMSPGR